MVKILSTGFVGICLACFIVSGCGDKADSPEKDKEEVVRQKLPESESQPEKSAQTTEQQQSESVAAKKSEAGPQEASSDESESSSAAAPDGETVQTAESDDSQETAAGQEKQETVPESPDPDKPEEVSSSADKAGESSSAEASLEAGEERTEAEETTDKDLEGESENLAPDLDIDLEEEAGEDFAGVEPADPEEDEEFFNPFEPLFQKEEAEALDQGDSGARKDRKILTPLEKISLGQLQLKGVITAKSGNRGIVTDSSGKGYVVKKGTYIGLNSGVVDRVEPDRVVVTEDLGGRINKTELKLQKPAGE